MHKHRNIRAFHPIAGKTVIDGSNRHTLLVSLRLTTALASYKLEQYTAPPKTVGQSDREIQSSRQGTLLTVAHTTGRSKARRSRYPIRNSIRPYLSDSLLQPLSTLVRSRSNQRVPRPDARVKRVQQSPKCNSLEAEKRVSLTRIFLNLAARLRGPASGIVAPPAIWQAASIH